MPNAYISFAFDNSYARDLPGFYAPWEPAQVPSPNLLFLNQSLAAELNLDLASLDEPTLAGLFAGNVLPTGATPLSQAYAGHQFGNFSPQLGDGRALLLGEVIDRQGNRRDIAFKGSGRTPFSRGGDGKAAVGPMLREVLIGEAMHALGIPTTRALAVVSTGESIAREELLPGAVLTRIAASHIRVGTFEYFAARGEYDKVRQLADYTIARHYPALTNEPEPYLALLNAVAQRQANLIAQWMLVGFIHGVMNTDNMTLSGETIDYGPCAFMEAYNPRAVFSSIDHQGRYAYGNQPNIARWNLARLAETLLPLLSQEEEKAVAAATEVINAFPEWYRTSWLQGIRAKLGLQNSQQENDNVDLTLTDDWLTLLHSNKVDFTLAWRYLADAAIGNSAPLHALFPDGAALDAWLARWRIRCGDKDGQQDPGITSQQRAERMRKVNPRIIPRNHLVEAALTAASEKGDLTPFQQLLDAIRRPFEDDAALTPFTEPAPESVTACYKTFCGT